MTKLKLTLVVFALGVVLDANAQFDGLMKGIANEMDKAAQGVIPKQDSQSSSGTLPAQPVQGVSAVPQRAIAVPSSLPPENLEKLTSGYCSRLTSSDFAKKMSGLMVYAKKNQDGQLVYPEITYGGTGFSKNTMAISAWVRDNLNKTIGNKGGTGINEKLAATVNKCFSDNVNDKIYLLSQQGDFDTVNGNQNPSGRSTTKTTKGDDVIKRSSEDINSAASGRGMREERTNDDSKWLPKNAREYFLFAFFFDGVDDFLAKLNPNPLTQFEADVQKKVAAYKAAKPVSVADFKGKWCQSIDKSTSSPVEYRGLRTGDGCLLPDEVLVGTLKKLKEFNIDVMNLQAPISSQLENVDAGELKFPLIKFVFIPKENKFYVGLFDALICPTSELNSLADSNSFRVALEGKYGKPSSVLTEYAKFKAQVDATEKMIADQKRKAITVAEAKSAREGEQQVNILKNMLNGMDQKTPAQLNWEYDSKNRVQDETGLIVGKLNNNDVSGTIRCKGDIPSAFMIQIGGTSSLQAVFKRVANDVRQNEANKEKNAPTPKF